MNTKSDAIYAAVSRIERAPNMSRVIDAYDAALGGSDVSCHRYRGQWQVWHGQGSGFCGDFVQVRAHLAGRAEELLERAAEAEAAAEIELAPAPVPEMVPQPVQQQQANAALAPAATPAGDRWVRVSSRIERPTLLEAVQASVSEFRSDPYTGRGKPVVRVDGASNVLLGWAENEEAAAACGRHWHYRFDVAVLVAGPPGPLAYALLGNGGPVEAPEPAQHTVEISAVANDFNSRMRGGTYYQILFLPDGKGGFLPGVRADQAEGAVILSRAAYVDKHASYAKAWERSSTTKVRITLPVGTLRKSTRGWVKRLNAEAAGTRSSSSATCGGAMAGRRSCRSTAPRSS